MLQVIEAAARSDVHVLLEGDSDTGKELVAGDSPFQWTQSRPVCGHRLRCAIPANLLESELFGQVRGAFTGATFARCGLMQEADHGTLFMDEISNLPLEMQSKMLRVLQAI